MRLWQQGTNVSVQFPKNHLPATSITTNLQNNTKIIKYKYKGGRIRGLYTRTPHPRKYLQRSPELSLPSSHHPGIALVFNPIFLCRNILHTATKLKQDVFYFRQLGETRKKRVCSLQKSKIAFCTCGIEGICQTHKHRKLAPRTTIYHK